MTPVPEQRLPWRRVTDGLALKVRVTLKSVRDAIEGVTLLADGQVALRLRVRAAPENGAANEAVLILLSKALKLRRSELALDHGETGRTKTIKLAGATSELEARLTALIA